MVLNIANVILVLKCLTTLQYLSFLFLAMRSATLFTNCLHSLDMPPVVRNTAGMNVAFSVLVNGFWPLTKKEGDLIAVPTECNSC